VLRLSLDGTIPIQAEAAEELKRQWQSGAVKPEARVKFSGEWVELALVNDTDKTRWFELKEEFYTLATLKTFPPVTLNTLLQIGRHFQDCPACPDMIVIPAGSFDMGSNEEEDEKPVHSIAIGFPFAMGKTEVTQGEWKAIMGSNPGNFKNCGDTCPVEQVSWDDAKDFVQKLSVKTGKQYRLPSEAEWEYACRAGGRLKYCGGDIVDKLAWYNKNSGEHSHAAATKSANAWGLYDMSGNVWEWVEDSYHADYNGAPSDGTAWQGDGSQRVLRGGSWNLAPELERVSIRTGGVPVLRDFYYGFRVVRVLP
jgi:formylglycine-generating enzyme required for sulfatase activity